MYLTISEVLGIMGKLKIFKSNLPNQKQSTRGEIYQIKSNQRVGKFTKSKAINAWGNWAYQHYINPLFSIYQIETNRFCVMETSTFNNLNVNSF